MKLEEAIKELEGFNSATFETRFITFSQALQLLIEAGKKIIEVRDKYGMSPSGLLPGETKD